MFNSPTAYCPRCRKYIALDERRRDCAAAHQCGNDCPLEQYFGAGRSMGKSRRRDEPVAQPGKPQVAGEPADREGSAG
jgi:hypothetical protein